MKLINNNLSPLAFYDKIAQQNHRKTYAFGQISPLVFYKNVILPFQVALNKTTSIEWVRLYDFNTNTYIDLSNALIENGLSLNNSFEDFTILKYPGLLPITQIKKEGLFYLAINLQEIGTIYSEVFTITNTITNYLLISYKNSYNFELKNGIVDFSDNFTFKCYIKAEIGKPEYSFEEEVTSRMGYSFIESQVSKKTYKFTFVAPEYLCDALRIIRLCDTKKIQDLQNQQDYEAITFSISPEWQDQGDLASVECEFETDNIIANLGGYKAELKGGDFNDSYNSDFKKQ